MKQYRKKKVTNSSHPSFFYSQRQANSVWAVQKDGWGSVSAPECLPQTPQLTALVCKATTKTATATGLLRRIRSPGHATEAEPTLQRLLKGPGRELRALTPFCRSLDGLQHLLPLQLTHVG